MALWTLKFTVKNTYFSSQAAQRELEEECGTDLKVQFLSNSPVAFHNYKHNTEKDSIFGSKV